MSTDATTNSTENWGAVEPKEQVIDASQVKIFEPKKEQFVLPDNVKDKPLNEPSSRGGYDSRGGYGYGASRYGGNDRYNDGRRGGYNRNDDGYDSKRRQYSNDSRQSFGGDSRPAYGRNEFDNRSRYGNDSRAPYVGNDRRDDRQGGFNDRSPSRDFDNRQSGYSDRPPRRDFDNRQGGYNDRPPRRDFDNRQGGYNRDENRSYGSSYNADRGTRPYNNQPSEPSSVLGFFKMSKYATEQDIKDFIGAEVQPQDIEKINLIKNRDTNESKGFAFLYFTSEEVATKVKNSLDGKQFMGRDIRIDYSFKKNNNY